MNERRMKERLPPKHVHIFLNTFVIPYIKDHYIILHRIVVGQQKVVDKPNCPIYHRFYSIMGDYVLKF